MSRKPSGNPVGRPRKNPETAEKTAKPSVIGTTAELKAPPLKPTSIMQQADLILTPDQITYLRSCNEKQQRYVQFRAEGLKQAESYKLAGFQSNHANVDASQLENKKKPILHEIIKRLQDAKNIRDLTDAETEAGKRVTALANQKKAEDTLQKLDGKEANELARQIKFYRDIVNGDIRSMKKIVEFNSKGEIIRTRLEYMDDVSTRIQARKELDRILGLTAIQRLGNISAGGNVNIMIVNAAKKDETDDTRNDGSLKMQDIEIIDGETVLIAEEVQKIVKGKSNK